jgi:hypothetical protein
MPPAQSAEAAEVAVRRDPLAARLDRERSQVGIGDEVSLRVDVRARSLEDPPVACPGRTGALFGGLFSARAKSNAPARGLGGSKTRGWMTTRTKPLSARSAIPYDSSDVTSASSQPRNREWSGASSR